MHNILHLCEVLVRERKIERIENVRAKDLVKYKIK